jgi:hypothetical protein
MAQRCNGATLQWRNAAMAQRCNGATLQWRNAARRLSFAANQMQFAI